LSYSALESPEGLFKQFITENDAGKAYYASLAQGIVSTIENNSTTADVAQALLFQVYTTSLSECISLLDAAKTLATSSYIVPNDLRAGIESAIKIFSSRVKDTPMKLTPQPPLHTLVLLNKH